MKQIDTLFTRSYEQGLTAADLYTLSSLERIKQEYGDKFCVSVACDKLFKDGWLDDKNEYTDKTLKFFESVSDLFKPLKARKQKVEIVVDQEMVSKYNSLFPAEKLPTGLYARCNEKELIKAFQWFFTTYGDSYSWDIILKATDAYINEKERSGYMFMRTSKYFLRKMQNDKSWSSDLATACDAWIAGVGVEKEEVTFSQKVV